MQAADASGAKDANVVPNIKLPDFEAFHTSTPHQNLAVFR